MEDLWNLIIPYIIILVFAIIGFCYAGKYIAEQKGRSPTEGILFGLLGILGLVILALLPSKDKSKIDSNSNSNFFNSVLACYYGFLYSFCFQSFYIFQVIQ